MNNFRFLFLTLLFSFALGVSAQEICNNAIDDDADGLIDLNDDECDCGEVRPLVTISGEVCLSITLRTLDPDALSYQWYYEGVAMVTETNQRIKLNQNDYLEGSYECLITTATGCYTSEPYLFEVPDKAFSDLGTVYLCPGGFLEINGTILTTPGTFNWDATDLVTGCLVEYDVNVVEAFPSEETINESICVGETFELYDISETTSGSYTTVIPNRFGCDSTITVILDVGSEVQKVLNPTICSGENYEYLDISESETGIYTSLISGNGACDTLLTVNLTVTEPAVGSITASICSGGIYEDYGLSVSDAGTYPVNLITVGGCDSLLTINLMVEEPAEGSISPSICSGGSYEEYGLSVSAAGVYTANLVTVGGCDSLLTINLSVDAPSTGSINESICAGASYTEYGLNETEAGTYPVTLTSANGCDSLLTINLTVDEPIRSSFEDTHCNDGTPYIYYDISATETGSYETVFAAANGCDSIVTVDLTVLEPTDSFDEVFVCEGTPFILYDIYAEESGPYSTVITNSVGCDSLISVNVIVTNNVEFTINETICQGDIATVRDVQYTEAGTYQIDLTDPLGCDSLITVNIEVLEHSSNTIVTSICEGETYEYGDISTDQAGVYNTILVNAVGCDSLVTIELAVNQPTTHSFSTEICEGDTYVYEDISTDEPGTYTTVLTNAAGCDSTITVDLVVNPLQTRELSITMCEGEILGLYGLDASVTDVYEVRFSNADGCDSIVTIDLVVNAPADLLELGEDMFIDLGETVEIVPEFISDDLQNLVWMDENGNILGFDRTLEDFKPLVDTRITLSGSDSNGCDVIDEMLITVRLNVEMYFPNVFSPNGDGVNDEFIFKYNEGVVGVEEVLIFDRWGEHIYTSTAEFVSESYMGWDGTFNGINVNPGVYVFMVRVNIIDGSMRDFSGDITVVR